MSNTVIKVENLSKLYDLGQVGTGTLSKDLNRAWAKMRGKPDPYATIAELNDRTQKSVSGTVYALKDINFEVKEGEVLGIIGKNGAGKSTLLKILSQITSPTTGSIKIKGRVASLLEVGTGMHPEMTARQNIYLNGAIMGMRRQEITRKLDEIIDFAGIGKYVDTPIKRFSSGMKVRLGFAVAAFLEPEILIVDEVLAVGDAEFQKKAIGKMQDVTKDGGRTVLFVSHNMAAMNTLCNRGMLLGHGMIEKTGAMDNVIVEYLNDKTGGEKQYEVIFEQNEKPFQVQSIELLDEKLTPINRSYSNKEKIIVRLTYVFRQEVSQCNLTLIILNAMGEIVWFIDRRDYYMHFFSAKKGNYEALLEIPNPLLVDGDYYLTIGLADTQGGINDHKHNILKFTIENIESARVGRSGLLFNPIQWEMIKTND